MTAIILILIGIALLSAVVWVLAYWTQSERLPRRERVKDATVVVLLLWAFIGGILSISVGWHYISDPTQPKIEAERGRR